MLSLSKFRLYQVSHLGRVFLKLNSASNFWIRQENFRSVFTTYSIKKWHQEISQSHGVSKNKWIFFFIHVQSRCLYLLLLLSLLLSWRSCCYRYRDCKSSLICVPFLTVRSPFWFELQTVLVDPSVDAAVVGLTGWIIFKASTVKLPSLLLLSTTSLSLASPSFAVTGVLKSTTKETITLPLLWKI